MESTFGVDLCGLIDLLGRTLHEDSSVFVRDLIRLGINSIEARKALDPDHLGSITIETLRGARPSLAFLDNGLGLTEDEASELLGTIGPRSIGLLSCFAVSQEIVILSRSARPGVHPVVEWRGRDDGTFTLQIHNREMTPGSQIYLTAKPGFEDRFAFDAICHSARRFAKLHECPIRVVSPWHEKAVVNSDSRPWRSRFTSTEQQTRELLAFGRLKYGCDFFDAIPIRSKVGGVEGVAFLSCHPVRAIQGRSHSVYLREILLSDTAYWLLPHWCEFVLCVVNIESLQPTTSGEACLHSENLKLATDNIGRCLRDYFVGVAARDPAKLSAILKSHGDSLKWLAYEDREFYVLMIDCLVFETSMGEMSIGAIREQFGSLFYLTDRDVFQKIAPMASARGLCLIFSPFWIDTELLARLSTSIEGAKCEAFDPVEWGLTLDDFESDENEELAKLIAGAENVLDSYDCIVESKALAISDPAALYHVATTGNSLAILTLNSRHPLVVSLATKRDREIQNRAIEMLYLQAMLASRCPLGPREMLLVNGGFLDVLQKSLDNQADEAR